MVGTTVLPRGRTVALRLADQVDVPTQAVGNFSEINTYAQTFNKKRPLDDDDITGQVGFANNTDARPAAPGLEDADGTLQAPLDLVQIGYWLKGALGSYDGGVAIANPAPAGTKAHTFASGAVSLPARTLERQFTATQLEAMIGAVVTQLSLPIGAAAGYAKCDVSLWGRQVTDPYNASIAGAPTIVALGARVPNSSGVITAGGVQMGRVTTGSLKISNTVTPDRYAGDNLESDAFLEKVDAALDITARYTTDALRALGQNAAGSVLPAVTAVTLSWQLSAYLKLLVTLPAVRFNPVSIAVQNGGLMTQQLTGRAEVGAGGPMVTAVLTNQQAVY